MSGRQVADKSVLKSLYLDAIEGGVTSGACPSYQELQESGPQYVEEELIGTGAIKEVYSVYDQKTKRRVALARLKDDLGEGFYDAFIHEAWLTSSLKHPNIIKVHAIDIGEDGRPYFTMDLKANRTLEGVAELDVYDRLELFLVICRTMEYAHNRGVLHLDLKPANIQYDDYGETLICDWGLGKLTESHQESYLNESSLVTMIGEVKGTPGYMSPEQTESGADKDERSDIFALGAILSYLMIGEAPFTGTSEQIIMATCNQERDSLSDRLSEKEVAPGVIAIILKCLERDKDARYQSVGMLSEDIGRYLRGYAPLAEHPSLWVVLSHFAHRHRVALMSLMGGLLVLSTLVFFYSRKISVQESESRLLTTQINEMLGESDLFDQLIAETIDDFFIKFYERAYEILLTMKTCSDDEFLQRHHEALLLLNKAYKIAPDSGWVNMLFIQFHTVSLNFEEVLEYQNVTNSRTAGRFLTFARENLELGATDGSRPDYEEFRDLFHQVTQITTLEDKLFLELMLRYQRLSSSYEGDYNECILALTDFYNEGSEEYYSHYKEGEMVFSVKGALGFGMDADEISSLSGLSLRTLRIEKARYVDCYALNGAAIEELDLSKVPYPHFRKPIVLHGIRRVYLPRHTPVGSYVMRSISSASGAEIDFIK